MGPTKYIFVTGGVTSSLGKGIVSASLGKLLRARGLSVTIQKFDPYINVDPGTLNPYEHGECYVTEDGAETDLDLGHYERFLNVFTSQANNVTTGRIYHNVITKEREGEFLGKTVQVIPHITDEIKRNFYLLGETGAYDIIITEIGGCVGDIESLPFIEAVRQARQDLGPYNHLVIHLTLVPYLKSSGELKTKPTQHSVKQLLEAGVQPDILVCRTEFPLPTDIRRKIALFCNVSINSVIESIDVETIYDVPIKLRKEKLDERVLEKLNINNFKDPDLDQWKEFLGKLKNPQEEVCIGLIGKYVELHDAYKSINESFIHAGAVNECKVNIDWISSESLNPDEINEKLKHLDGILIAPGFGERGIPGKIEAARFARENNVPFFGICLGMQCASIEYARSLAGLKKANSTEFMPDAPHKVIVRWRELPRDCDIGGTMRLGQFRCDLKKGSLAHKAYRALRISERHRHRYEFNPSYQDALADAGMIFSGMNPDYALVEIIEAPDHPWFLGCQFHPEFKSKPLAPHPLFKAFIGASYAHRRATGRSVSPGSNTRK
jgi:CTP synthase